jgi:hypothetical protein
MECKLRIKMKKKRKKIVSLRRSPDELSKVLGVGYKVFIAFLCDNFQSWANFADKICFKISAEKNGKEWSAFGSLLNELRKILGVRY